MSIARRAALGAASLALAVGGLVAPALATSAPAWAQGSGLVPFTPGGLDTTSYTIGPASSVQSPWVVETAVGFVNEDLSNSVSYSVESSGAVDEPNGAPSSGTVRPGQTLAVPAVVSGSGTLTITTDGYGTLTFNLSLGYSDPNADNSGFTELQSTITPASLAFSGPVLVGSDLSPATTSSGSTEPFADLSVGLSVPVQSCAGVVAGAPFSATGTTCQVSGDGFELTIGQPEASGAGTSLELGDHATSVTIGAEELMGEVFPAEYVLPLLYEVSSVAPVEPTVAGVTGGAWTPLEVTVPSTDLVELVSATVTGADASDFKLETLSRLSVTNLSELFGPTENETWTPVEVSLATSTPGTYSADVVLTFDPAGDDYTLTVPVSGSVGATSTSGSSGSSGSTGRLTLPSSPPSSSAPAPAPPPPAPSAVGETCGPGGTEVQLWGSDLAGSTVRFADQTSGVVTMLSGSEAEVAVPHGVTREGRIVVVGPGGQAVPVPDVTWDPACPTELLAWTTPLNATSVALHLELAANGEAVPGQSVVVLGKDGEQVTRLTTTSAPSSVVVPDAEGPFVAVFDGSLHWQASESAPIR